MEAAAKAVRSAPPDLVPIAVPAAVTPPLEASSAESIRSHTWILHWSLSFGLQEWDIVAIAPSVLTAQLTPQEQVADAFSRKMIQAQHVNPIVREPDELSPPERILENWFRAQLTAWFALIRSAFCPHDFWPFVQFVSHVVRA